MLKFFRLARYLIVTNGTSSTQWAKQLIWYWIIRKFVFKFDLHFHVTFFIKLLFPCKHGLIQGTFLNDFLIDKSV